MESVRLETRSVTLIPLTAVEDMIRPSLPVWNVGLIPDSMLLDTIRRLLGLGERERVRDGLGLLDFT